MKKNPSTILTIIVLISVLAGIFVYQPFWGNLSSFRPWRLGLDIAGGTFLVYDIDLAEVEADHRETVVNGLRDVIERRVNFFGVSEPRVYTQDVGESQRLVVELAGIQDVNEAINEIGETPLLDFREVVDSEELLDGVQGEEKEAEFIKTNLTGRHIEGAQLIFSQVTGSPIIGLELTDEGATIFEELTGRNVGKPIAIFLDDQLIEVPTVQEKISGGSAQITGNFTVDEAKQLVQRFNAGALPAPITLINQHTVSPGLGKDSLDMSIKAGLWGIVVVILFMILYYRRLGLFASAALLMYIALVLGIFKLVPITLTLAGIAGFILSVGMAVDANILVFERTKEELRRGLPYSAAVEEGFKRAWSSIRDSNITTIISSLILFILTTSFVKGFALALLIGVLMSMFSAITITRTLLRVFSSNIKP